MRKAMLLSVLVIVVCSGDRCLPDADFDGVPDDVDACANTPLCAIVDEFGCPSDDDGDGVTNGCDLCEETPAGTTVYGTGCAIEGDGVAPRCQGPDPRAKEIEYSLVNRTGDTSGTILIKGVVDNYGLVDYLSSAGLQDIQLWADSVMIDSVPFEDLAVDETVTVEDELSWDLQSEFPPVQYYKLLVTYDPDILFDGDPNNDDCRLLNNLIIRSTDDVATLFE